MKFERCYNGCKKHQHLIKLLLILLMVFAVQFIFYSTIVSPRSSTTVMTPYASGNQRGMEVDETTPWEQTISTQEELAGVSIYLGTYEEPSLGGILHMELYDAATGEKLDAQERDLTGMEMNEYIRFVLPEPVRTQEGLYRVVLRLSDLGQQKCYFAWFTDAPVGGTGIFNGNTVEEAFAVGPVVISHFLPTFYWCICAAILFVIVLVDFLLRRNLKIQAIFAGMALTLGILYIIVYPVYGTCDECVHIPETFARATELRTGHFVKPGESVNIRKDEWQEGYTIFMANAEQYHYFTDTFFQKGTSTDMIPVVHSKVGCGYQYAPQVFGVLVSRILNLGQTPTLFLAQMCSLLCFILVCCAAISVSPFPLLFAVLALLPNTLRTAGSFSYDTFINGMSLLFLALIFQMALDEKKIGWKKLALTAGIYAFLAPCKLIYTPMILLFLLIPNRNFEKKHTKLITFFVMGICGVLMIGLFNLPEMQKVTQQSEVVMGPWGNPSYTLSSLLRQPMEFLRITISSVLDLGNGRLMGAVGDIQHDHVPGTFSVIFCLLAMFAAGCTEKEIGKKEKVVMGGVYLLVMLLGYAASASWTSIGSYYYMGMQGRYMTPVLPLLFLLFNGLLRKKPNEKHIFMGVMLAHSYTLLYIMLEIIMRSV